MALGRRWPSLLAFGVALLCWGLDATGAAGLLPVLPLIYVVVAVLNLRRASWPILAGATVYFVVVSGQDQATTWAAVVSLAGAVGVAGLFRRGLRAEVVLQLTGLLLFGGIAAIALLAAPDTARWVVGAGWLAHSLWDLAHLRRGAVVSRSYAEWCAVFDVLMALQLLATP